MVEEVQYQTDPSLGYNLRDLEEKTRLLKERILLISRNFVDDREKNFREMQELKKSFALLKEENIKMREMLQRIVEQLDKLARKEDLMILQRQFDLFRQ